MAAIPLRLAALMEIPVIYIFTHDSIGVGEDGPTHQPIEQLASLRAIPGSHRRSGPADANEVVEAWKFIMKLRHEPVRLILTPPGGADPGPHEIRLGRGSAARRLCFGRCRPAASPKCCCWPRAARCRCAWTRTKNCKTMGIAARVVSMPSWEIFERIAARTQAIARACCRPR